MAVLTGAERGFLLLTSSLGNPERKPLTVAQFRELVRRSSCLHPDDLNRDVALRDLTAMGYNTSFARHILDLLSEEAQLDWYLARGEKLGCIPVTRASEQYPILVRRRLGNDAPGVLWGKGDLSLLNTPAISLVGSRDLHPENLAFARAVGRQAAMQRLTLVSGNARGADKAAQNACLAAGGRVISVVADALQQHEKADNILYLSENGFDESFSAQRALSRNCVIHTMGRMVFVAQASFEKGGTWDGTVRNLRSSWSSVLCFRDGSEAFPALLQMGAFGVTAEDLEDLSALQVNEPTLFDR